MSDSKSGDDKTLHVASKKTLTIKRGGNEQGVVRQNFSHGRTKAVVVETKKRKFTRPDEKVERNWLISSLWRRIPGGWENVFSQDTAAAGTPGG